MIPQYFGSGYCYRQTVDNYALKKRLEHTAAETKNIFFQNRLREI